MGWWLSQSWSTIVPGERSSYQSSYGDSHHNSLSYHFSSKYRPHPFQGGSVKGKYKFVEDKHLKKVNFQISLKLNLAYNSKL